MINRFFFLLIVSVFLIGNAKAYISSDSFPTHTQYTPELEPASLNPQGSFQIASVCFLGSGCDEGGFIKNNENMDIDPSKQCQNEGYLLTSCPQGKYPQKYCPYNNRYFASCGAPSNQQKCETEGYFINCDEGKSLQASQSCPYDSNYKKCVCTDCSAYSYTLSQATAAGYETDGSCNSCGTVKYKRKKAECNGFKTCECGGEIGASTCKSGTDTKYSNCKECPKCDNFCFGSRDVSSLKCTAKEVAYNYKTQCGEACYACCKPSCHTEDGDMIGGCGPGKYVASYDFNGPIYKDVAVTYRYGDNYDSGCGNTCWSCYTGKIYYVPEEPECYSHDNIIWKMSLVFSAECIMSDGVSAFTSVSYSSSSAGTVWSSAEKCEAAKEGLKTYMKKDAVGYCRTMFNKSGKYIQQDIKVDGEHSLYIVARDLIGS